MSKVEDKLRCAFFYSEGRSLWEVKLNFELWVERVNPVKQIGELQALFWGIAVYFSFKMKSSLEGQAKILPKEGS